MDGCRIPLSRGVPKAGIGLGNDPVVDGATRVVNVLMMLTVVDVVTDFNQGVDVVGGPRPLLGEDRPMVGLEPIRGYRHLNPSYALGIKAPVSSIL